MFKPILILLIVVFLSACSSTPVKWDKIDKELMTSFTILDIIDYNQTREIQENPNFYEKNPIIKNANKYETAFYFAGCWITTWKISHSFLPAWRKAFLIGANLFEGIMVSNNKEKNVEFKIKIPF